MTRLRRRAVLFVLGVAAVMAALPAINLVRGGALPRTPEALFDTGFAWPAVSGALRRIGVSTRPGQVVVGKSGWLFMGDQYAQSVTDRRRPADAGDRAVADRLAATSRAWGAWLATRGVGSWHVLVCADKETIYPELLPDWYRPAEAGAIDVMVQRADPRILVDSRTDLRAARSHAGPALYLRTDSHWTARGAWVAYRSLARAAAADAGAVRWLGEQDVRLRPSRVAWGDLARLLDARGDDDDAAVADIAGGRDAGRTFADAATDRPLALSAATGIKAPARPTRIRSPAALNPRRLLWVRDSFGAALLPYVTATFAEVVEVDRESVSLAQLAEFVRRYEPDSVLVSVVERNARVPWFESPPPASAQ
jgi:hypothetical protein